MLFRSNTALLKWSSNLNLLVLVFRILRVKNFVPIYKLYIGAAVVVVIWVIVAAGLDLTLPLEIYWVIIITALLYIL